MPEGRRTPMRIAAPPEKMPFRLRAKLALAEVFPLVMSEENAATLRWLRNNIDQPRRCQCGAPGTVAVTDPRGGHVGDTPPAFWRCEAHTDVPLTVPWRNGVPQINQTRDECSWKTADIRTSTVTDCGCGTHVGEKRDDR